MRMNKVAHDLITRLKRSMCQNTTKTPKQSLPKSYPTQPPTTPMASIQKQIKQIPVRDMIRLYSHRMHLSKEMTMKMSIRESYDTSTKRSVDQISDNDLEEIESSLAKRSKINVEITESANGIHGNNCPEQESSAKN
jgi:hypothetical protein